LFKIFKKIKKLKHLLLSIIFEKRTIISLNSTKIGLDIVKSFQKVKYKGFSQTDKKILNLLNEYRLELRRNIKKINFDEIGLKKNISVSEIVLKASSSEKWNYFFYELSKINYINNVLEIGTNLGVSGQYFLKAIDKKKNTKFITIEGVKKLCEIARNRFEFISSDKKFKVIHGLYDEKILELKKSKIKFDLVFIDGNHRFDSTIKYYELLRKHFAQNAIVIFDDINWSVGMVNAWKKIIKDESVVLSIDFFKLGIIIFNKKNNSNCNNKYKLFLSY